MNQYPFINPIIVTKDNGIIDGLHRSQACELMYAEVKTIEMNFSSEQILKNKENNLNQKSVARCLH